MLDFARLNPQVAKLGEYRSGKRTELAEKTAIACEHLAKSDGASLRQKADAATTSWLVGLPLSEAPSAVFQPPRRASAYTAIATDGSQIAPSREAVGALHLINIGSAVISYGDMPHARLKSEPSLFFETDDLVAQFGGEEREVAGPVLAVKRDLMEYEALSMRIAEPGKGPVIGLVDGTLILWHVEPKAKRLQGLGTADLKKRAFDVMFGLLRNGREADRPVVAYISAPGATNVVNLLRIDLCTESSINCGRCAVPKERRECMKVDGLSDALLFRSILKKGERSAVFMSGSSNDSDIVEAYPDELRPCFFYLNTGVEVARVELPYWLAEDRTLLGRVHGLVLDQAIKGLGYPVALAEAHEQAVVKGADRETFNRLVELALIKQGIRIADSRKSLLKRRGFV